MSLQGDVNLLLPYRDLYGLYDVLGMEKELENLLKLAEQKDEFEITRLLAEHLNSFRNLK